jgi:glucose/arabinose dehydrogenase
MKRLLIRLLLSGFALASANASAATFQCASDNGGLNLPAGFCASVFSDDLGTVPRIAHYRPMGLAQAPDGALYLYIDDSQHGRVWRIVHKH